MYHWYCYIKVIRYIVHIFLAVVRFHYRCLLALQKMGIGLISQAIYRNASTASVR